MTGNMDAKRSVTPNPCPAGKRHSMWKSLPSPRGWETTVLKPKLKHTEVNTH